jgi:hypothetical protein
MSNIGLVKKFENNVEQLCINDFLHCFNVLKNIGYEVFSLNFSLKNIIYLVDYFQISKGESTLHYP